MGSAKTAAPADEYLTRSETADLLKVKPQTLAKWASTGVYDLPFTKLRGGAVRYRRSDVDAFMLRHRRQFEHAGGV